jgi:NAD(P)-dependent dehydrogenase (short-subunit alcohol dehydrogenase family)
VTRLAGKVVLITGGGTGIGRGIALACAREGAKVAVVGRRLAKLQETASEIKAMGAEAIAIACDVSRFADAQNAIQKTVEAFGKLNVLANNAGVLSVSTIEEIPEDEWDRLINANLKGPFLMCRAALPEFRKVGGGSIVNVGSVLGLVAMKKRAAYCASKGGLTLLTKAIAIDHGHENIRANCICPSIVETDLVSELFKTPDGERAKLERLATIPLARFGKPNDIAGLAVFLASDESSWLTGAAIPVDGGLTAA